MSIRPPSGSNFASGSARPTPCSSSRRNITALSRASSKNAIDVGSRPYGKSAWAGKPGAVVSVSPGAIGGFGANHHLRQSLVFLDVPVMQQPEAYIGNAASLFDKEGHLTNDATRDFLTKFMGSFATWIEANAKA